MSESIPTDYDFAVFLLTRELMALKKQLPEKVADLVWAQQNARNKAASVASMEANICQLESAIRLLGQPVVTK